MLASKLDNSAAALYLSVEAVLASKLDHSAALYICRGGAYLQIRLLCCCYVSVEAVLASKLDHSAAALYL